MLVKFLFGFFAFILLLNTNLALAVDITACVVDPASKYRYYHLPNTSSKLICELGKNNSLQTMTSMYAGGWSLIQVVKLDSRYATKDKLPPSPILYFEK